MILRTLIERRVKFVVIAGDIYVMGEKGRSWNLVVHYRNRRMIEPGMTKEEKKEIGQFREEVNKKYAIREMKPEEVAECRRLRFEGLLTQMTNKRSIDGKFTECTVFKPKKYEGIEKELK